MNFEEFEYGLFLGFLEVKKISVVFLFFPFLDTERSGFGLSPSLEHPRQQTPPTKQIRCWP